MRSCAGWCRGKIKKCSVDAFMREGATVCVAWDGETGSMQVSVDGAPYVFIFPPDTVRPSAAAGAALFPAIGGVCGCVVEYSMRGELGLAPPSPDYLPCYQVRALEFPAHDLPVRCMSPVETIER
jgi:hypothetical protein